ncbi:hypothetical protein C453_00925 [Haloferax elongans ATCC BAA-1513]|uniref:PD-(D/E)XK endonuclease-like domain-containing protein n=1 Tax=Haloferax elongans ATCC BAA-1513 TaxID=1230453 RepID=M0HZ33_HALEO|nr:hypothetical protein [Haloferax elongans]ELZ88962.1 hypothetical protein C453_00925 [Haloferax elongans ATCC BAA-1513]
MAGDRTHSTTPAKIARHQLALFESISEADLERIIPLSTIETQHYCEQKAQFERAETPDDESLPERLIRAQEQHNELVETTGTTSGEYTLADAWDDIQSEDVSLLYPPLAHELVNMVLIGRPTFLRFVDGRPVQLTLVRGVTKDRYLEELFPNEQFLLWCHGNLLDRIGFDVSDLSIRYLKYSQSKFNAVEVSRAQLLLAGEDGDDVAIKLNEKSPIHPNIRQHPLAYERDTERGKQLRAYAAFWRDGGEPSGANHWKKCVSCRFNTECDLALAQGEVRR